MVEGDTKVTVSSCHIEMVERRIVLCCLAVSYFQEFALLVARVLDLIFFSFLLVRSPSSSVPLQPHGIAPQLSPGMT